MAGIACALSPIRRSIFDIPINDDDGHMCLMEKASSYLWVDVSDDDPLPDELEDLKPSYTKLASTVKKHQKILEKQ